MEVMSPNFRFKSISSLFLGKNADEIFLMTSLQFLLITCHSTDNDPCVDLGAPNLDIQLTDEVLYPVLQDSTPERLSMVLGSSFSMRRLMTNAKIHDSNGKEPVKPPFFYSDAIMDNEITMTANECRWVQEVDGHKIFLSVMARCYSVFNLQYVSIPRIMEEKIAKYQDGVAFRKND